VLVKELYFFFLKLNLLKSAREVHIIKITPAFVICINRRLSTYCGAVNPHIHGFLCVDIFVLSIDRSTFNVELETLVQYTEIT